MSAPLQLYSLATSNGVRVSTFLEELKATYGLQYECAPPPRALAHHVDAPQGDEGRHHEEHAEGAVVHRDQPERAHVRSLLLAHAQPASDSARCSPALVDPNRGGFQVFESAAILLYLEQHYDGARKFAFDPATQPDEYSEMLQWMFFAHGGIGRKRLVARE
jgi:glutathione S-transferase